MPSTVHMRNYEWSYLVRYSLVLKPFLLFDFTEEIHYNFDL